MCHIISLMGRINAASAVARTREAGTTGEIVIFPGVRYERWKGDTPPKKRIARKPARTKRPNTKNA